MNTLSSPDTDTSVLQPAFYVVSVRKLIVMNSFTFGFYWLFWSLRNWDLYQHASREKFMFLPRAALPELFLYSLLRHVDRRIRNSGRVYRWSPWRLASGAILTGLLCWVLVLISVPLTDGVLMALTGLLVVLNYVIQSRIQRAINFCEGDPDGATNTQFTLANWLWISIFTSGWLVLGWLAGWGADQRW